VVVGGLLMGVGRGWGLLGSLSGCAGGLVRGFGVFVCGIGWRVVLGGLLEFSLIEVGLGWGLLGSPLVVGGQVRGLAGGVRG
jgi:hypothetical protein